MSEDAFVSRRDFLGASAAAVLAASALRARHASAAPGARSAARYIVARLAQHGADILFGVPGATCDPLFAAAAQDGQVVVASSDLEAGYAADGYARTRGLAALSVTYGVGTMSLLAVIGGAYAERSAIVVVNGGPSKLDLQLQRQHRTLFSHSTGREHTDLEVFERVTAYAARAERKEDVPRVVDDAIRIALRERRPTYVEIPKDLWDATVSTASARLDAAPAASGAEPEVAQKILERLSSAKRPVLLLGVELGRYGLTEKARTLVAKLGVPYATTMLAKAVIPEATPHFAGVYIGQSSVPATRELLERADAVLALGCVLGRQYREVATKKSLTLAADGEVRFAGATTKATLGPLLDALLAQTYTARPEHAALNPLTGRDYAARRASLPAPKAAFGYDSALGAISEALDDSFAVVTDTSLSMYPAADLNVPARSPFVCNGVWQAIGFSVGAAVGVALGSGKRPLVVCGDGGFQMTAQALSTMARAKMRAIVVVLDNGVYGIEQYLLDPRYFQSDAQPALPYVTLNRWRYPELAKALGFEHAQAVSTLDELRRALAEARTVDGPALISVVLSPRDLPAQLERA